MPGSGFGDRVFLNVPFDRRYKALFEALVFAVHDCGLVARCALEGDDGSVVRLDKCESAGLEVGALIFLDYRTLVSGWLRGNPW